ncbi:hypothetical protein BDA96_08G053100 [Sorghum bicolor]|uniref:Acyltransferase n=1 Tax=Sorghum bicolor TaxID=4558 RepID=A0A921QGY0_SORBI|nr:hypothetical protein BDA96_08G053100 [Sorghum bicolor]
MMPARLCAPWWHCRCGWEPSTSTSFLSSPASSSSQLVSPRWCYARSSSLCSFRSVPQTNGAAPSRGSYANMGSATSPLLCMWSITKPLILKQLTALYVPFMRQIWTWLGSVPATREKFFSHLADGYSCVVCPGGLRETHHMNSGSEVAFIKSRKGFVRMAIQNGSPLVPVFCFGQSDTYRWWNPHIKSLSRIATALKFIPVIYWGKFGMPIPFPSHMHVFVGKPILVEKNGQPTTDEVNEVHRQFVIALQELFEKNKAKAGYPSLHLQIM